MTPWSTPNYTTQAPVGLLLSLRRNSTGPANMIGETLQTPEGANTLAASGCLDLLNKILLALYFQDSKRVKKN